MIAMAASEYASLLVRRLGGRPIASYMRLLPRLRAGSGAYKAWIQVVVNHHVYKCLCRRKQAGSLNGVDRGALIYSPPQDRDIYAAQQQKLLLRALGSLSEQERLLYKLCFVFDQDAHKIATVFKIDVKNVYKRRQKLALKLTRLVQTFQSH